MFFANRHSVVTKYSCYILHSHGMTAFNESLARVKTVNMLKNRLDIHN